MKPYQSKNSETSIDNTGVEIASHLLGTMFPAGKYRAAAARALLHCLNSIDSTYWALPQPDKCTFLVFVQRILPIKAPMLLGCKPCTCLLMADFHGWCVLVNIFLCSDLTDCEMSGVRWELGSVSDGLEESAVSSVDYKARKSKETWILLFSVVVGCSSSYLQDFLCCLSQQWFKNPYAFSGKELPECGFGILVLFFLFSKRFNTLTLHLFALYIPIPPLFIPIIIPVVRCARCFPCNLQLSDPER